MKLCKKIYKVSRPGLVCYYNKETGLLHNPKGPAEICYEINKDTKAIEITRIYYRENDKYKDAGFIYFSSVLMAAQWGSYSKGFCEKHYYDDLSVRIIYTFDRFNFEKSNKWFAPGRIYDNIKKEFEIAKRWI